MCGIVGFTGNHQAAPILLYGLSRLEYRGYDSAGLAVRDGECDTEVIKAKGRLKVLADKTNNGESVPGTCGINLELIGVVPMDELIYEYDSTGIPLVNLPEDSKSKVAMKEIFAKLELK